MKQRRDDRSGRSSVRYGTVALLALAWVASCRPQPVPPPALDEPRATVQRMLQLGDEPTPDALATLFGSELSELERARLLDTLEGFPDQDVIIGEPQEIGPEQFMIDLVRMEDGEPRDGYAVELILEPTAPAAVGDAAPVSTLGPWRIVSLSGPDLGWPRRRTPGDSLSTYPQQP